MTEKYLVDSNIIIYHLNGNRKATNFLRQNIENSYISRLTFIEVLSFDLDEDTKNKIIKFLNLFEIIDTSEDIAIQAIKNRAKKKIKIADNIIASTSQIYGLTLVTRNVKDFRSIEIRILNIID